MHGYFVRHARQPNMELNTERLEAILQGFTGQVKHTRIATGTNRLFVECDHTVASQIKLALRGTGMIMTDIPNKI